MEEQQLKMLARMVALEAVAVSTAARLHRLLIAQGVKVDMHADREMLQASYATLAIPGIDPAMSDLLAAELTQAIDELLHDIAQRVNPQG